MAIEPKKPWWTDWDLSYASNIFGPIYGGMSVQEAFTNTMKLWFPTYVAEVNRKIGSDVLVVPVDYKMRPDYRPLTRDPVAAIAIDVPHTLQDPEEFNSGIRATWKVNVEVFVFGTKDFQETQALTYAYATCLRALIMQHRGLGGFAQTTQWLGDEYLAGEPVSARTIGIAHMEFAVTLGNVGNVYGGPLEPAITPPASATEVATSNISIEADND